MQRDDDSGLRGISAKGRGRGLDFLRTLVALSVVGLSRLRGVFRNHCGARYLLPLYLISYYLLFRTTPCELRKSGFGGRLGGVCDVRRGFPVVSGFHYVSQVGALGSSPRRYPARGFVVQRGSEMRAKKPRARI